MVSKALKDDSGQTNIDFLFGVGVFLVTFLYAATFIPGLFAPYQPGAIDLSSVAYRTSAMLVEDPGWYSQGSINGTAWEDSADWPSRIGLADDKEHPNMISMHKINKLNDLLANKSNYSQVQDSMGLNGSIIYDVNVTVTLNNSSQSEINTSTWPVPSNYNVESIERNVLVDMGKEMFIDCGKDQSNMGASFIVNLSNVSYSSITHNLTIRIFNTSGTINNVVWSTDGVSYVAPNPWVYGVDYFYYVNGTYQQSSTFSLNDNDIAELVITPDAIYHDALGNIFTKYIKVSGVGSIFPDSSTGVSFNYFQNPKYPLKSVCYPGTLKLEVWSYALA